MAVMAVYTYRDIRKHTGNMYIHTFIYKPFLDLNICSGNEDQQRLISSTFIYKPFLDLNICSGNKDQQRLISSTFIYKPFLDLNICSTTNNNNKQGPAEIDKLHIYL